MKNLEPSSPEEIISPFAGHRRRTRWNIAFALALMPSLTASTLALSPVQAQSTTLLSDSMTRTVSAGWGTSGATNYILNSSSRFAVNGNQGSAILFPGKRSDASTQITVANVKAGIDVSFDSLPSAGSSYAQLISRSTSAGGYTASLRLKADRTLLLEVSRSARGTNMLLNSQPLASNVKPGSAYHVDFEVSGSGSVSLKARAFPAGSTPSQWQINIEDSSNERISAAGLVKFGGYLSRSAAVGSGLHFDNLQIQELTQIGSLAPIDPETAAPLPTQHSETPTATEPIPSTALYVSTSGQDTASGTASAPLRSISRAVAKANNGQSIVVRAGSYHDSVIIPAGKSIKLRNYPGETVWLDGSQAVTGFTASGAAWAKTNWNYDFDTSPTYTRGAADNTEASWGFTNSTYPLASHPDQVWIDGIRQNQVASVAKLTPGTFFVDRVNNKLYLGTNPTGKAVRASTLVKALSIRSDNSSVSGINARKYAPSVPDMGAITAERPGIVLENLTVEDNATTGVNISAVKNTVRNVKLSRNGMLGMNAVYSDGLVVDNLTSTGNNLEHFNSSPVSGGLKIGRSRTVTVKNSKFLSNYGPGLWLDESVYDSKVLSNDMIGNTGHGLSLEISAKSLVANNRITKNGGNGIKLNNTSDVRIWNNTISGKNRILNIVQDARRASRASDPGHDPRQPFPDATMTWIVKNIDVKNNVLSNTGGGNAILAVEDYSGSFSAAQMNISMDSNAYHRTGSSTPNWSLVWSRVAGNPAVYTTLANFTKAVDQDQKSFELTSPTVLTSSSDPSSVITSKSSQAASLPSSIASLIGQTTGAKRLGNFTR